MVKRTLLNIGGFAVYVGAPLIPVAKYWDFFVTTDAKTTVSTAVLLVLIAGVSVLRYIFKGDKLPFKVNYLWVIIAVATYVLIPIMEKVFVVACFGAGGSVAGSFLFKQAENSLIKAKDNSLAEKIADKMNKEK